MYARIILNDMKKNKFVTASVAVFILLAALLTSLAAALLVNLLGAVDGLLEDAKTPHFLQMHAGDINMERLSQFAAAQETVESFQVLEFLNVDGASIRTPQGTLAGSVQDNGLCVQSGDFDFLLDSEGEIIRALPGEIYIPIAYWKERLAVPGDRISIHGVDFTVAGFVRDSQMNSAMASSKRFLISDADFETLRPFGRMESLIEFRLTDVSAIPAFEAAYLEAGLEANGPPGITIALFRLANALSDGIMIAVLVLVGLLVVFVAFLCIRFTLLAKIEEDYREIGVLKAIGLRLSQIKKIYMAKYSAIAVCSCLLGFLLSLPLQGSLAQNVRLYLGQGGSALLALLCGLAGAGLICLVIVLYVWGVLRRFDRLSAAQAIRFGAPQEKQSGARGLLLSKNRFLPANVFLGVKDVLCRKALYVTMLCVLIVSTFILVVPQNIYHTVSSRSFITYMGIGNCDMRFDVQQTDNISEASAEIAQTLEQDAAVSKYAVLFSLMFDMPMDDGATQRLKVELGDHTAFPVTYAQGRAPQSAFEIALSTLSAEDLGRGVGDAVTLLIDGEARSLSICGIYSDITNGGKTAKAAFQTEQTDILWSIIPVQLSEGVGSTAAARYQALFPAAKVSDIGEYISQTFGSTISAIQKASVASIVAAALLCVLVTLLFLKMLVTKDRYAISVLKSLGFTASDIRAQYIARSALVLLLGLVLGTVLANTLGELVGAAMISSFGVTGFRFEINPIFAYLVSPLLIATCVYAATLLGISEIRALKVSDHIKE